MNALAVLWAECPWLVAVAGMLSVMTGCMTMLAAYALVCPEEEAENDDI